MEKIGQGAFATVYKATYRKTGAEVHAQYVADMMNFNYIF